MHSLPELQSRFYATMLRGDDAPALGDLLKGDRHLNLRRIEAYRRNVFSNLCSALALTYPVVQKIVGEIFFREMARAFVRKEPSRSGDLNDYGAEFGSFIAGYPHAVDLPYLPDVARLEWELQRIDLGADVDIAGSDLPFAALATTPGERYDALYFMFDPVVVRFDSDWPLADIWRVNQVDYSGDMQIDFACGCQLLLWRTPRRTEFSVLTSPEAVLLDELIAGRALAPAVTAALEIDAGFQLGACLQHWIVAGVLRGAFFDPERTNANEQLIESGV